MTRLSILALLPLLLLSCTGSNDSIFFSWTAAEKVDSQDSGSVTNVVAVTDTFGQITVTWTQSDGARQNLWSNRFSPTRGWGNAEEIESADGGDAQAADLHVDRDLHVTAIWRQHDGTRFDLWTNRYTHPVGWGTPQKIDTEDLGDVQAHSSVMDTNGNITVVWRQADATRDNQWANHYDADSGWEFAAKIETEDLGDARNAVLSMDSTGNTVAVWAQSDGTRDNQWSNRHSTSTGWGVAVEIETEDLGTVGTARLVQESTHLVAVWPQSDGTRANLWANRLVVGIGWGIAVEIETEDLGDAFPPEVVIDSNNVITVIWKQSDGTRTNLWGNRHTVGGGWGTADAIESATGNINEYRLYVDSSDRELAIWTQSDGTRDDLWSSGHQDDSDWSTPDNIDSEELGDTLLVADAAYDGANHLTVVWQQEDGTTRNQWSNRHHPINGWGTATKIETEDLGDTRRAQLVIDSFGHITVVWRQQDTTRFNQWTNRYVQGVGWGTAETIETLDGDVQARTMLIDARGRVTVLWPQSDGTIDDLWAARYK